MTPDHPERILSLSKDEGPRLIPDLLKHGDKTLRLGQRRPPSPLPCPIGGGGDTDLARAWREWMGHVVGGRIGG